MTRFLAAGENYRVVISVALAETVGPYALSHIVLMMTSQRDIVSFLKDRFYSDYHLLIPAMFELRTPGSARYTSSCSYLHEIELLSLSNHTFSCIQVHDNWQRSIRF